MILLEEATMMAIPGDGSQTTTRRVTKSDDGQPCKSYSSYNLCGRCEQKLNPGTIRQDWSPSRKPDPSTNISS